MALSLRHTLVAVAAAFVLHACTTHSQVCMERVEGAVWSNEVSVEVENSDTVALRQLNILLRHNSNFDGGEVPLRIKIVTPDGRFHEEQHTFAVDARVTPSVVSSVVSIPYRSDVQLSMGGVYMFVFEPLARLRGVEAVGIELK